MLLQPLVLAPRLDPLRDRALAAQVTWARGTCGTRRGRRRGLRASERTTALNAEVAGLGATRRVVLWDTLLGGASGPTRSASSSPTSSRTSKRHLLKGVAWFALVAPLLTCLVAVGAVAPGSPSRGRADLCSSPRSWPTAGRQRDLAPLRGRTGALSS